MRTRPFFAVLSFVGLACGGSSQPPAAPAAPAEDAPAETVAEAPASTEPEAKSESAPPVPDDHPSSPGIVSTGGDDSEGPDPCAAVAAPYEEKVRPLFNQCYQEGKKKNPELQGLARIAIAVNAKGKVTSVKPAGTSELGKAVLDCIVTKLKSEPFEGAQCASRTVTIAKQYGGTK